MAAEDGSLADEYDCLLLDLDGTVYRGSLPTPGAVETLNEIGSRRLFLTNNASRSADEVAQHLGALGLAVTAADVVTSAHSAARVIASRVAAGSAVLVVGTCSLGAHIEAAGLTPVRSHADAPVAVVQGHSPRTTWTDLAQAALAIRGGALWVATNGDVTLPTERGLLPGNGSMIAALRAATGAEPEVVGKPGPTMFRDALTCGRFHAPLVIGDRLDTDIAGANAAGLPSLLVLSGVSTAADLLQAEPGQRPTYVAADLRGLKDTSAVVRIGPQPGWRTELADGTVIVTSTGGTDALSAVRAVVDAAWRADARNLVAGDEHARKALAQWALG